MPRVNENDLISVLSSCKVTLTNEERIELQSFIMNDKDAQGQVSVINILKAMGLPIQTLGVYGSKTLPRKILR